MMTRIGELTSVDQSRVHSPSAGCKETCWKTTNPLLPNPPNLDDKCVPPAGRALVIRNVSWHAARREPGVFVLCEHIIHVLPRERIG